MVEIKKEEGNLEQSVVDVENNERYRLLYSKSKVYVHPTAYARDNIPGFVTLVKKVRIFYLSYAALLRYIHSH